MGAARGQVWVTRTQPGAQASAARLDAMGWPPLVAPLLQVCALAEPGVEPPGAAGLVFTSPNGVSAYAAASRERAHPVWAVGEATAEAARVAGFARVRSAGGDVDDLARLLRAERPAGPLVHPCGRERAGDLAQALADAGVQVRPWPLYETRARRSWPPAVQAAAGLAAVLLHSPKAGRTLAALQRAEPLDALAGVRCLGLSQACVAPLAGLGMPVRAAGRPEEAALLACLR